MEPSKFTKEQLDLPVTITGHDAVKLLIVVLSLSEKAAMRGDTKALKEGHKLANNLLSAFQFEDEGLDELRSMMDAFKALVELAQTFEKPV